MIDEVIIRPLRAEDAPALETFYNGLGRDTIRLFHPLGWNVSLSDTVGVCEAAARGERYDLVLDHAGSIVGWAFLANMNTDTLLFGIGIAETYRGRGFGRRLMQGLIDEALRRGKKHIELTVVQTNIRARKLYENFGFKVTGALTGKDDGLDYFKMALEL